MVMMMMMTQNYNHLLLQSEANFNMFPVSNLPLSNAGGESITQKALDFWKAGRDREEIQLEDLETLISRSVFNNKKSEYKINERFFVFPGYFVVIIQKLDLMKKVDSCTTEVSVNHFLQVACGIVV